MRQGFAGALLPACVAGVVVVLFGPTIAPLLGAYVAALLVALALLFLPGRLLLEALADDDDEVGMRGAPAAAFACSLAVITPACLAPFLFGGTLAWFVPGYVVTLAILGLAVGGSRRRRAAAIANKAGCQACDGEASRAEQVDGIVVLLTCTLTVIAAAAAWKLTAGGSIDRWWYLAYVRHYTESPALSFGEPFFDGSVVASRFAFNVWLSALAVWARQSGLDPIFLYERVCPLILVPTALSAAICFGRSLFHSRRTAWLLGLASVIFWLSGSLFPVLSRMPEDKLLALLVLAPISTAAALQVLRKPSTRAVLLLAVAAVAQSSVHPLVYLLAATPIALATAWMTATRQTTVAAAAALVVVLLVGGLYPAVGGAAAGAALRSDGADLSHPDHPVTRVHLGRDRLLLRENGGYLVTPRLLFHPLTLLALACLPLLRRRSRIEKAYILPAALAPPLVAFVPAVAGWAGSLILPWMVYRVLWVIPYTALLTIGMQEGSKALARLGEQPQRWIPPLVMILFALPSLPRDLGRRVSPQRLALTTPAQGPFRDAMAAVATLGPHAAIVASPEISERIPAFTGRRVLAASDRATVVFSGSRRRAERRLRIRATWMAGVWHPQPQPSSFTHVTTAGRATHLLVEPGTIASRYCGRHLFRSKGFDLCELSPTAPAERPALIKLTASPTGSAGRGTRRIELGRTRHYASSQLTVRCDPQPESAGDNLVWPRPGPWSAAQAHVQCIIRVSAGTGGETFRPRALTIKPALGRAVEEFTVVVAGERDRTRSWRGHSQARLHSGEQGSLALPHDPVDTVSVTVVPDFLPFLKLEAFDLEFEPVRSLPTRGTVDENGGRG